MMAFVEVALLTRAMEEQFGAKATYARLRDLSAFKDPDLNWMMERVKDELMARRASALRIQELARVIATHLARNYADVRDEHHTSGSLPEFKVERVTDWISAHLAKDLYLEQLAKQAGLRDAGNGVAVSIPARPNTMPAVRPLTESEMGARVAWRQPRLEFSGTPLIEAAALMNRHSRVQLRIEDPAVGRLRVSGIFGAQNCDSFVRVLEMTFDLKAERRGNDEIVLRRADD